MSENITNTGSAWIEERILAVATRMAGRIAKNAGVAEQLCFPHAYLTLKEELSAPAAPAVDAAKLDDLGKLRALAEAADQGEGQHIYTHPRDSNNYAANDAWHQAASPDAFLRIAALVAQQAARIEELEQQAPDFEAIGWAYTKLQAFGCGRNNLDSAMMLDRLNLMLLEGK